MRAPAQETWGTRSLLRPARLVRAVRPEKPAVAPEPAEREHDRLRPLARSGPTTSGIPEGCALKEPARSRCDPASDRLYAEPTTYL
jgi:hypothetical protein